MTSLPKTESQTVEFKASFNKEVIESLVAFSNAEGGSVYIGIANDGSIKGVPVDKETIAIWTNDIRSKTAPAIIPDVETVVINDKTIVIFKVFEYPIKPVSVKGRYYKRIKNTNQLLTISEVVNLHLQSINSSWDAYPDALHTLEDISLDKVQACIETMREKGITITDSPLSFLFKFSLIREDKPTNAAYLMFKNDNSIITTIELGRFQDEITIKDTARSKSDILVQVDEVINYVKKHINLEVIITGEPKNTQKWQYPMEAIREIVLNMVIHRDYRSSSDSIVKIFNDKIEFYNPGRLPDTISIKDLLSGNYKSTPRNKKIADFFKDLGLIEKYGSGIQRIIGYFKADNLPLPEFKNISDGFQVTVFSVDKSNVTENPNSITENVTENEIDVTENVTENMEDVTENREKRIIDLIIENNYISTTQIAEEMSVTRMTVHRDLEKLKSKGLIERVGPDKGGYWRVLN
jgi:ATP-dependent DNA helicase RecG